MSCAKSRLTALLLISLLTTLFISPKATAVTGVTVTPATPTITLPKDHIEAQTTVNFTNNYNRQVTLHLAVAVVANATAADRQVPDAITFDGGSNLTLQPGQTVAKTLRLHDQQGLQPGSQRTDLVITQDAAAGNVGVSPQLRLPLVTIKQDGAITAIALAGINRQPVAATTPNKLGIIIKNTGNMLAIPRGAVEITSPGGKLVAKGTLNIDSQALAPGQTTTLSVPLTKLENSLVPGQYKIDVSYGLGGGASKTASASFVFVAWWHIAVALIFCAGLYMATKTILNLRSKKYKVRKTPHFTLASKEVP